MRLKKGVQAGIIIICLAGTIQVFSKTTFRELNNEAIASYQSGNYLQALKAWQDLKAMGNSDPDLYYNIGNTQALLGNIAEAILAYEKALRFKPHDQEIKEAIQTERNKIENNVIPIQSFFLIDWYEGLLSIFRPQTWAILGLMILLAGLMVWLNSMQRLKFNLKLHAGKSWIYFATGLVILAISMLSYRKIYRLNEGVLFSACELRQGPSDQSPTIRLLQAGEKVSLRDKISDWNKVVLLNLDDGWIKSDCIRIIDARQ